ncbi:MAG: hypothetical protein Q8P83_00890 [bacterium]|nr:hypothetical protein [bacterium]
MFQETEEKIYGIPDPDLEPDAGSLSMNEAIEAFKVDVDVQAVYSVSAEAIDEMFEQAREKFFDNVDDFESFVADFTNALKKAVEQGEEPTDVIERFRAIVQ